MEITYTAPESVRAVVDSLGRTEDVRFSPSNRRIAIVAFRSSTIAVFDVEISAAHKTVALTRAREFTCSALSYPHGVDFINEETIVVVSREGKVAILRLPLAETADRARELSPLHVLRPEDVPVLVNSGSVSAVRTSHPPYELLVCNSGGDTVTRHLVQCSPQGSTASSEILLQKWLRIPDGVSVSDDRQWIAISNHDGHNVLIYRNRETLNRIADPDGILRSVTYPHGVRFSPDGEYIFVADAGAPYVHVYAQHGDGWQGMRNPVATVRTMDDDTYFRGRHNPKEGGPKGMDIDAGMNVLVTTCECQPLAFFDMTAILQQSRAHLPPVDLLQGLHILEEAHKVQAHIAQAEADRHEAQARAAAAEARARRAEAQSAAAEARATKARAKANKLKARPSHAIDRRLRRLAKPLRRLLHSHGS